MFWDLYNEPKVLGKQQGIVSNNIEDLYIDSKNNIFVSTNSGLSKIWIDTKGVLQIKNYTTFHGLPSNEVNNVIEQNDTIYIATGKGIGVLAGEHNLAPSQDIIIDQRHVNGLSLIHI